MKYVYQFLNFLNNGQEIPIQKFVDPMAVHFQLTEEERNTIYEKGKHNIFSNRVFWALSYLNMSGLVTKPKRGVYKISDLGLKILKNPETINEYIKKELIKRRAETNDKDNSEQIIESDNEHTPEESLYNSFEQIKQSVYSEIIDTILKKTPREFESVVFKLLQNMGYGGQLEDSGYSYKIFK